MEFSRVSISILASGNSWKGDVQRVDLLGAMYERWGRPGGVVFPRISLCSGTSNIDVKNIRVVKSRLFF